MKKRKNADPAHDVLGYERQQLDAIFRPETVAVVGATASPNRGLRARALEAGAGEVLATSASGEEVIAAARRLGGC